MFLHHLVPWPPVDIHRKFYGDRPRETPPAGELYARGVVKYSDFGPIEGYILETCKIGGTLLLITMSFRLVPKSVTMNDLEQRNGRYFSLFQRTRVRCRRKTITSISKSTFNSL